MLFLFPSDYFNFKLVDEMYRLELQPLQKSGFATATISIESLDTGSPKVHLAISLNIDVLYRGWMLNPIDYKLLIDSIEQIGAKFYTLMNTYLATHYLPACARRIDSKFFSIDIIERRDGVLRVVEIDDGQVSGLVGRTPERFAEIWADSTEPNLLY